MRHAGLFAMIATATLMFGGTAWAQGCGAACPEMVSIAGNGTIAPFEVSKYEITFDQWAACVSGGGCTSNPNPRDQGWGRGNRPVIHVSWNDAQEYVRWLSTATGQTYRLLTEAEWDYAARAGTTTKFSWGDKDPVCDQSARNGANFVGCVAHRTQPVGSFQPNGFGLYDVHGNVWEWVEDAEGSSRVLRGGSWDGNPQYLRSARRIGGDPPAGSSSSVSAWPGPFKIVSL